MSKWSGVLWLLLAFLCGCASSTISRTRDLIEQGELREAATVAQGNWSAKREVALAILASSLELEETRDQALRALVNIGPQALELAEELVDSQDAVLSTASAAVLLPLVRGSSTPVSALLRARLDHPVPEVRALAVRALGTREEGEWVLRRALQDSHGRVRRVAVDILMAYGGTVTADEERLIEIAREDTEVGLRAKALRVLSRHSQSIEVFDLLVSAMGSEHRVVRFSAIDALAHSPRREGATAILQRALISDDEAFSMRAASVLASWGDERAIDLVRRAILENEGTAARTAALAAGGLGESMIPALRLALEREDPEFRLHVAASLIRLSQEERAIGTLRELMDEPGWTGMQAALVMADVVGKDVGRNELNEDEILRRLAQALSDPDEFLRAYTVSACALVPGAERLIGRGLADPAPRVRLAAALSFFRVAAR